MSGGSMDYFFARVTDAAETFKLDSMERIALRDHLLLLARALRAVEWNDSGDGDDKESALIRECLAPRQVLAATIGEARRVLAELQAEIERALL